MNTQIITAYRKRLTQLMNEFKRNPSAKSYVALENAMLIYQQYIKGDDSK